MIADGGLGARFGQGQAPRRSTTRPSWPVWLSGLSTKTVVVGAPAASRAADHVDAAGHVRDARVGARLGKLRALGPLVEVAGPDGLARRRPSTGRSCRRCRRCTGSASRPGGAAPSVRGCGQVQLGGRRLPRDHRPDRRRARQRLVGRRAEVDRRPDEDAQVDRPADRQVVRPVREVAEHQDDDDEPGERLDRSPRPAVRRRAARTGRASAVERCRVRAPAAPSSSILCRRPSRSEAISLSGQGPRHVRVDRAHERVRPGREGRHLVLASSRRRGRCRP